MFKHRQIPKHGTKHEIGKVRAYRKHTDGSKVRVSPTDSAPSLLDSSSSRSSSSSRPLPNPLRLKVNTAIDDYFTQNLAYQETFAALNINDILPSELKRELVDMSGPDRVYPREVTEVLESIELIFKTVLPIVFPTVIPVNLCTRYFNTNHITNEAITYIKQCVYDDPNHGPYVAIVGGVVFVINTYEMAEVEPSKIPLSPDATLVAIPVKHAVTIPDLASYRLPDVKAYIDRIQRCVREMFLRPRGMPAVRRRSLLQAATEPNAVVPNAEEGNDFGISDAYGVEGEEGEEEAKKHHQVSAVEYKPRKITFKQCITSANPNDVLEALRKLVRQFLLLNQASYNPKFGVSKNSPTFVLAFYGKRDDPLAEIRPLVLKSSKGKLPTFVIVPAPEVRDETHTRMQAHPQRRFVRINGEPAFAAYQLGPRKSSITGKDEIVYEPATWKPMCPTARPASEIHSMAAVLPGRMLHKVIQLCCQKSGHDSGYFVKLSPGETIYDIPHHEYESDELTIHKALENMGYENYIDFFNSSN